MAEKKGDAMRVYLSIGKLAAAGIRRLLERTDFHIVSYEPTTHRYEEHKELECERFDVYKKAVWSRSGVLTLHNTPSPTICKTSAEVESEEVPTVCINDVLRQYDEIEVLNINCEGAEIEILRHAKSELLTRCKKIIVEFHVFRADLECSQDDVDMCLTKLSESHDGTMLKDKYPLWEFKKKKS